MDSYEDIINTPIVKQMLSKLSAETHFSSETLVSYACHELSDNARSKVASHLKDCRACADVVKVVQDAVSAESGSGRSASELKQPLSLPPKLERKAKLIVALSDKREAIVEDVAKLLVDEEFWSLIRPTLKVMENQDRTFQATAPSEAAELPVAAFASSMDTDEKKNIEVVVRIATFFNLIRDLIVDHCEGMKGIQTEIAGCIDEAYNSSKVMKLDDSSMHKIADIFCRHLLCDE